MTERDSVRFGTATIEYAVRRSGRRKKTVQITVDGGGVRVAAPLATPDSELRAIVRKRASWILSHSSKPMQEAARKRFISGETLPYLGRNVRMIVQPTEARWPEVYFDHWRFRISAPKDLVGSERHERIRRVVVKWYRARAAERLTASVDLWRPWFGLEKKPRILIRDQRQRWGSCAPDGTLRFNWRTMMLKPALAEYIVIHELAHLTHPNHSADFWALVSRMAPDMQRRRQRLREEGQALPL